MWTKHLTSDGRSFYYNAAQNRSLWHPPSGACVHEAVNIKIPVAEELEDGQISKISQVNAFDTQQQQYIQQQQYNETINNNNQQQHHQQQNDIIQNNDMQPNQSFQANTIFAHNALNFDDMINHAATDQKLLKQQKIIESQQQIQDKTSTDNQSSYLKEKNSYVGQAVGSGNDDVGKWLVR
jgi:hypothetical protein